MVSMKLQLFNIASFKIDGGAMFGVVPKALWSRAYPSDENNLIVLSLRSLIVEANGHVILIDTGWGDKQDEKFFRHVYLHGGEGLIQGVLNRGYRIEDITDVFLTHLHADHCGGAVMRNETTGFQLTFPHATHHVSRKQWDWALMKNLREEDSYPEENILPIGSSGKLNLIEDEGELFPGFSVLLCNGHTPGLMVPEIRYNDKTFVFAGDLIPTAAHIPLIWNMSYDIESLRTIEEKKKVLEKVLINNQFLIFQHDEQIECCNLKVTEKGIRMNRKFDLSDLI